MAGRFTESFDKYGAEVARLVSSGEWDASSGTATLVPDVGWCGTYAYNQVAQHAGLLKTVGNLDQTLVLHLRIKPKTLLTGTAPDIRAISDAGDVQWFFNFLTTGEIEFWRGPDRSTGTLLATSAVVVTSDVWFEFESVVLCNAGAGTVELRINGIEVIGPLTGVNTRHTSLPADYTQVGIRLQNEWSLDDVVMMDGIDSLIPSNPTNTFIGPGIHVDAHLAQTDADEAGFYAEWTPSAGSDLGAMVDEIPPDDDATYNESTVDDERVTYRVTPMSDTTATVFMVNNLPMLRKTSASLAKVRNLLRIGGVDFDGPEIEIDNSDVPYKYFGQIFDGDPVNLVAWTPTVITASDFGVRNVGDGGLAVAGSWYPVFDDRVDRKEWGPQLDNGFWIDPNVLLLP